MKYFWADILLMQIKTYAALTYSKSTMEIPEQCVKFVQS